MLQPAPYKAYEGQTLFDASACMYGDASVAMQLSYANDLSITDILFAGQVIKPVEANANLQVLQVYKQTANVPATGLTTEFLEEILPGGIGYMQIGNNFKVS